MPADAFVDHCLELLAPHGAVRAKRMFGGHGFYVDDLFVALIAFERLYLKVDAQTEPLFAAAGSAPFVYEGKGKPVTMSYWSAPDDAMESPALMHPWARHALAAALRARAAKPLSPRKAAAPRPAAKRSARGAASAPPAARRRPSGR